MASGMRLIPALFVVLWATGFIGARYAMPWAEPFSFLAVRFVLAFAILGRSSRFSWAPRRIDAPRHRAWRRVAGVLMHGVYLGGVFWAIHHGMPAGLVGADRRPAAADHRGARRQPARRKHPAAPLGRAGGRASPASSSCWRRSSATIGGGVTLADAGGVVRRRRRHERRHDLAEALRDRQQPAGRHLLAICRRRGGDGRAVARLRDARSSRSTANWSSPWPGWCWCCRSARSCC